MINKAAITAFKAVAGDVPDLRLSLTDADAMAVAAEVGVCSAELEAIAELGSRPGEEASDEALIEWALAGKIARAAFWEKFEGTVVEGVELVRKR
jgi:hypothetical protein